MNRNTNSLNLTPLHSQASNSQKIFEISNISDLVSVDQIEPAKQQSEKTKQPEKTKKVRQKARSFQVEKGKSHKRRKLLIYDSEINNE